MDQMKPMDLNQIRKIQNKIFLNDEILERSREQNFLYFLGEHPYLFQEFTDTGFLTNAEMNYIVEHFQDYNVDPLTFENEFKRAMRESLPRYNNMKSIELIEEVFSLVEDKTVREIVSQRATSLASNGTKNSTTHTTSGNSNKSASKQVPMTNQGGSFNNLFTWGGAAGIGQDETSGNSDILISDLNSLLNSGTDSGNSKETVERHGDPVEHINRIWNYLLKPKAIEYLTSQLSYAFILVY